MMKKHGKIAAVIALIALCAVLFSSCGGLTPRGLAGRGGYAFGGGFSSGGRNSDSLFGRAIGNRQGGTVSSTRAPETTTKRPEVTTRAPETTTKANEIHTYNRQSGYSYAPAPTTAAPVPATTAPAAQPRQTSSENEIPDKLCGVTWMLIEREGKDLLTYYEFDTDGTGRVTTRDVDGEVNYYSGTIRKDSDRHYIFSYPSAGGGTLNMRIDDVGSETMFHSRFDLPYAESSVLIPAGQFEKNSRTMLQHVDITQWYSPYLDDIHDYQSVLFYGLQDRAEVYLQGDTRTDKYSGETLSDRLLKGYTYENTGSLWFVMDYDGVSDTAEVLMVHEAGYYLDHWQRLS